MKQNRVWIFLLAISLSAAMEPPKAPAKPVLPQGAAIPFKVITPGLKKTLVEGAHKTVILNAGQAQKVADSITLAIQRTNARASNKLILLFVHKGNEAFAPHLADQASRVYKAFGQMAISLAANRFNASGPEKGRPLSNSQLQVPESEIELISYTYGQQEEKEATKLLDLFIHSLETLNAQKNLKIAIVAAGESAHIVNSMSQEAKRNPLDTLIYFQSPIYEWSPTATNYSYNPKMSPQNFVHLYHLYTKDAPQIPADQGRASWYYLERKYRQQARIENGSLISPVKNIRALKVDLAGQLVDVSLEDFFDENAIKNYFPLFEQADFYQVNSDLIAKVFEQSQEPQEITIPAIAINRFVKLNGDTLEQSFGSSIIGSQYFYPIIQLQGISLKELKRAFSLEVEESLGQLVNITSIPAAEGWYIIKKLVGSVGTDIARIKQQHIDVLSNPLFEFTVPAAAQQFSYIITDRVRKSIQAVTAQTGLSQAFIEGQMKLGAYYMSSLLTGHEANIPTRNQEEYLRSIIAIIWFLYNQAIENKQMFQEGTFVIEDTGWRINNFLMNYIQTYGGVNGRQFKNPKNFNSPFVFFNQPLTQTIKDPELHVSYNPYGYPRESSHYKVSQKEFRHYGIDIRIGTSAELPLLPASKRHLLFGKIPLIENKEIKKQLLFIKPENYGLYYKDGLIYHGKELLESWARKANLTITKDDDPSYAKERIPTEFLKEFAEALEVSDLPPKTKAEAFVLAQQDNWGMKILYFDSLMEKPAIKALEKKYNFMYAHLPLRSGREVIITHQDLQNILRIDQQQQSLVWMQKPVACERVRAA